MLLVLSFLNPNDQGFALELIVVLDVRQSWVAHRGTWLQVLLPFSELDGGQLPCRFGRDYEKGPLNNYKY